MTKETTIVSFLLISFHIKRQHFVVHYVIRRYSLNICNLRYLNYLSFWKSEDGSRVLINCLLLASFFFFVSLLHRLFYPSLGGYSKVQVLVLFPSLLSGEKGEESTRQAGTIAHFGHAAVAGSSGSK